MKAGPKSSNSRAGANVPERASRARQRQRLIDACISALHMHGPSRTTVEKVVAIAEMSPGIVRFYFDSKDAMLVASLAYLAAEFEQRVMAPVARLEGTPVEALEQLVELYFDPDISSPRKVSVWYSFWGEASSRQEYLEICGRKDDDFAALVHTLVERLIGQSGESHLDADGVALGLIGVLEVLWQGIAFTNEALIDRGAAKKRSRAFLRSVFPRQFAVASAPATGAAPRAQKGASAPVAVPAWAYSDTALLSLERERLFRPAWQLVGHETDIPRSGDFLTVELAGERALVLRDKDGTYRAYRNTCRKRPHALVTERRGHFSSGIPCGIHGLTYEFDGSVRSGNTPGDLPALDLALPGRFVLVRTPGGDNSPAPAGDWVLFPKLTPSGFAEIDVAADWKLVVEQWLDALARPQGIRRTFLPPNQLLEIGPTSALVLQVIPVTPGSCRIHRLDYAVTARAAANKPARSRHPDGWLQQDIEVAESTQSGLTSGATEADDSAPATPESAAFRRTIVGLLSQLPPRDPTR